MSSGEFIAALAANFIVAGVVASLKGTSTGAVSFGIGLILLVIAYLIRKKATIALPPASMHQENKQEFNPQFNPQFNPRLYIGTEDHSSINAKQEQDTQERLVLDFLKKSEHRFYLVAEIAEAVNISKPDARATLERLEAQKSVWKVPVQAPGSYAWQLDDLERD